MPIYQMKIETVCRTTQGRSVEWSLENYGNNIGNIQHLYWGIAFAESSIGFGVR